FRELVVGTRELELLEALPVLRSEALDQRGHGAQLRVRALERDSIRAVVYDAEHVAGRHTLVLVNVDSDDRSGHLRADHGDIRPDVYVRGRDVAAAGVVNVPADREQEHGSEQEQQHAQPPPSATRRVNELFFYDPFGHRDSSLTPIRTRPALRPRIDSASSRTAPRRAAVVARRKDRATIRRATRLRLAASRRARAAPAV